jgi:hypothetical protein
MKSINSPIKMISREGGHVRRRMKKEDSPVNEIKIEIGHKVICESSLMSAK